MYASVRSAVRQGQSVSSVIDQCVGLRQGCILSPCLFSLFISDLPKMLEEHGSKGVWLYDVWLRVLLYADDGALLANSAEDLQKMLDILRIILLIYCAKWRLFVNVAKTEIVVFNRDTKIGRDKSECFFIMVV